MTSSSFGQLLQCIFHVVCIDGGTTWSKPNWIVGGSKDIIGQPMPVVDRKSGNVIVQYISSKGSAVGDCNWQITSKDDGNTWQTPRNISQYFGKYVGIMNGPGMTMNGAISE